MTRTACKILATRRARGERAGAIGTATSGGFTLIDTLVSISVVVVLIALLLPSLGTVQELTRRVVCSSNLRQVGLGLSMYSDDHKGALPGSIFNQPPGSLGSRPYSPQEMTTLRLERSTQGLFAQPWDGMGFLVSGDYLTAPKLYYCPSHRGSAQFGAFADNWATMRGTIRGNYHYRGPLVPLGEVSPQSQALVADSLRNGEANHASGVNAISADMHVQWVPDVTGELKAIISNRPGTPASIDDAWNWIDHAVENK